MSEIGTELFNQKLFHQGEVSDMAISIENQWTAVRPRQQPSPAQHWTATASAAIERTPISVVVSYRSA